MSTQQHPDAEELARYQAGEIGGPRGGQLAAHIADCARCASVSDDLAAVSRVLASVPAPSMPDAVESRITAALAAEAATRQAASPAAAGAAGAAAAAGSPADSPADSPAASPAASEERSRRLRLVHSGRSKSHARGFRPAMAVLSAAACLVLVGFGYLLSRTGSSSSSAPASAAAPAVLPAGAAASAAASGHAAAGSAAQPSAGKAISPSASALRPLEGQQAMPFLVTNSGTDYEQATLAAQVRGELNRRSKPSGTGRQSSGSSGGLPPSQPLIGCVEHVTGNVPPRLVDQATYEGKAAYVIAVSDYAWVVGPGCTASNSDLIASVALPG
jgi:hypothetical protein